MRVEFKYLVPLADVERLRLFLEGVGVRDKFCKNGSYVVSSLYFDSVNLGAFWDKAEGVFSREKFRVRFLDGVVVLEKKCKAGILGWKDRFYKGDSLNGVALEFRDNVLSGSLVPFVTISYNRLAFVVGDCRVTIDSDIVVEKDGCVLDVCPGFCVFEVKFINNRLPSVIYDAIRDFNLKRIAFSKYYEGVVVLYGKNPRTVVPEQFCISALF